MNKTIIWKLFIWFVINFKIDYYFKDKNNKCCYLANKDYNGIKYTELKTIFINIKHKLYVKNYENFAKLYDYNDVLIDKFEYKELYNAFNIIFLIDINNKLIIISNSIKYLDNIKNFHILEYNYFIANHKLYKFTYNLVEIMKIDNYLISNDNTIIVVKNKNYINFYRTGINLTKKEIPINFDKIKNFNERFFIVKNDKKHDLLEINNKKLNIIKENIILEDLFLLDNFRYVYKNSIYMLNSEIIKKKKIPIYKNNKIKIIKIFLEIILNLYMKMIEYYIFLKILQDLLIIKIIE